MAGRQIFSDHEKVCLQELIIKYKINSMTTMGAGNPAVKKTAWARLTEEYNSIETNCRRTEAQLKKCWDNLKTRQKQILALQKRERIRTGGGPYIPASTSTHEVIEEALLDCTDMELQGVIDSDFNSQETVEGTQEAVVDTEPHAIHSLPLLESQPGRRESTSGVQPVRDQLETPPGLRPNSNLDCGLTLSQTQARNVRARVVTEEFGLRRANYHRAQEREEELHKLKVEERQWLTKAAQESFKKAVLDRESAEELLLCNRAKREEAELMLGIRKNKMNNNGLSLFYCICLNKKN